MRKVISATFPVLAGLFLSTLCIRPLNAQQYVIANKDNTRPETNRLNETAPVVKDFAATKFNGYNEVSWTGMLENSTRKFIVEYSTDGINYLSAGQVLSNTGRYSLKHYTNDNRIMIYRIRMEELTGKYSYSSSTILDGAVVAPVNIYPTIVRGSVINANATLPVERLIITSTDGRQQFAKDLNGASDFIPIVIPQLGKGIYYITFYGNGWKTTSEFLVS